MYVDPSGLRTWGEWGVDTAISVLEFDAWLARKAADGMGGPIALPPQMFLKQATQMAANTFEDAAIVGRNAREAGHSPVSCTYQIGGVTTARLLGVEDATLFIDNTDAVRGYRVEGGEFWLRQGTGTISVVTLAVPIGRAVNVRFAGGMGGSGWIARPEGTRLRQVGNYWIKEVDPNASAFWRWWGRGSLNAQARALDRLGDMATPHLYKNGKLVMRDVGEYVPGNFWRTWAKASCRLGTPMNDIRPRNMGGPNNLIFDPALHPVQQGAYWTLAGVGTAYGGVQGYTYFGEDNE